MTTRIRIRRLVLEGVPPGQRAAVEAAFRAELARLVGKAAMPARPTPQPVAPADGAAAGRTAAAVVARSIGPRR